MLAIIDAVETTATRTRFSRVVRVDRGSELTLAKAYGFGSWGSSDSGEPEHGRDLPMVVDDMVCLGTRGR
ncbi:MAG TPA: hypothetical protein VLB31_12005, partial [Actinomycetota bacterium]|nr:hypothetical protein [Actinomycetota bacterium]